MLRRLWSDESCNPRRHMVHLRAPGRDQASVQSSLTGIRHLPHFDLLIQLERCSQAKLMTQNSRSTLLDLAEPSGGTLASSDEDFSLSRHPTGSSWRYRGQHSNLTDEWRTATGWTWFILVARGQSLNFAAGQASATFWLLKCSLGNSQED